MDPEITQLLHVVLNAIVLYAPKFLLAIVVLYIGFKLVKVVSRIASRAMEKGGVEFSLAKFIHSMITIGLKLVLFVVFASMIGIETTSLVALLGAAGLAVGLALQGSLANFAGGVLLLLFKPFKVGDFIETQGHSGSVSHIEIFNTFIKTPDNKTVIIPNGVLSNGVIKNFTAENKRRVDFLFGIGYGDDIAKAKQVIQDLISSDERILTDPPSLIGVSELGDSSVNLTTRVWVETANYWGVYFDMMEKVKLAFDKNGISIPFPQQDVHLFQEKN